MSSLPGAMCRIKVSNRKVITQLATASCLTREHKKCRRSGRMTSLRRYCAFFEKYFRSRVKIRHESLSNYNCTRSRADVIDDRHPHHQKL